MKRKPNFLLISSGRSGTTSLFNYYSEHPEIYMAPNKEPYFLASIDFSIQKHVPNFFLKNLWTRYEDEYYSLFENVKNEKVIGEASVSYLYYFKDTISNIKKHLRDPKIIIIIRNPIDRAYSHYLHNVQIGIETETFEEALKLEKERIRNEWWWGFYYKAAGYYFEAISEYINSFSSVKVFLFDDFIEDVPKTLKEMFQILDVNENFVPNIEKAYNKSIAFKYGTNSIYKIIQSNRLFNSLYYLIPRPLTNCLKRFALKNSNKINTTLRKNLYNEYRSDIACLEKLLSSDLTRWKPKSETP